MQHNYYSKPAFSRKSLPGCLLAMLIVVLLTACGDSGSQETATVQPTQEPVGTTEPESSPEQEPSKEASQEGAVWTVMDELGHEVNLPANPVRIFAPYMEDSLLSLNVLPVAQWGNGGKGQSYLQDRLQDVPAVDFAGGLPPSPELIMAFEPDLIILHNAKYAENGVYEQYSKIAPTYVFKNAAGDLNQSVAKLGELLGKTEEAKQALANYEQKKEEAKTRLFSITEGKKAALINFNGKGMYLIGGNYFGGYVLAHELGIGQTKLVEGKNSVDASREILPELDADFIFTINYGGSGEANMKELMDNAIWNSMSAVKNGHVYEASDEYWTGSGLIAYGKIIDDVVRYLAP